MDPYEVHRVEGLDIKNAGKPTVCCSNQTNFTKMLKYFIEIGLKSC